MTNRPFPVTTTEDSGPFPSYSEGELTRWITDMYGEGVLERVRQEFAITVGINSVTIGTGGMIIDGWYWPSTTIVTKPIPTPSATTRHRIVARKNTAAKVVTIELLVGTNGAPNPPAPGVVPGGVYEMLMWEVVITPQGAITVNDERPWAYFRTRHVAKEYAAGSLDWHILDYAGSSPLGHILSGTLFPGGLPDGTVFHRTDRDRLYFLQGSSWISLDQQAQPFIQRVAQPFTTNGTHLVATLDDAAQHYVDYLIMALRVNGTNDAQNHWNIRLEFVGGEQHTPLNFTTATLNVGQWYRHNPQAYNVAYPIVSGTNNTFAQFVFTRAGNPGSLDFIPQMKYRMFG